MSASTVCGVGSTISKSLLVRTDLELLPAFLVHVRRTVDRETLNMRWQRDRTPHPGTRTLRRVHDLFRAVIEHSVIVRLQANAYVLVVHDFFYPGVLVLAPAPRRGGHPLNP